MTTKDLNKKAAQFEKNRRRHDRHALAVKREHEVQFESVYFMRLANGSRCEQWIESEVTV